MKVALAIIFMLTSNAAVASSAVNCDDVKYGGNKYHESMEKLHSLARLRGDYFNRYHEHVVKYACEGNLKEVDFAIKNGWVTRFEVVSISKVLGLDSIAKTYSKKP